MSTVPVTAASDYTISCDIAGLDAAATVEWFAPDSDTPLVTDASSYEVEQGSFDIAAGGTQKTTLLIKSAILKTLTPPAAYKCSVKSGEYPSSPASQKEVSVTVEGELFK